MFCTAPHALAPAENVEPSVQPAQTPSDERVPAVKPDPAAQLETVFVTQAPALSATL